ncbi:MAG: GNAT family N-acetyltransferase [Lachnospiraceae bacterium]|nr:GNAT family N-acetyltransferase [Lachnospiraceae bacterium]
MITNAQEKDKEEILKLYRMQIGRKFCPWDEHYPSEDEIEYDLSRDSLFVMKDDEGNIIAAISIDSDEQVEALEFWSKELSPGGELSRLAVHPDHQNKGIAPMLIKHCMEVLKERGYKSVHFLVNKNNEKALRSYASLGIPKVGETFMYEQPFFCYESRL